MNAREMTIADILRLIYIGPLADILRPVADVDRWFRAYCDAGGSHNPWNDYLALCASVGTRVIGWGVAP